MSVETAQQFLELLEDDEPMRTQLFLEGPQTAAAFVEFATNKGFIFSEDDLREALRDHPDSMIEL